MKTLCILAVLALAVSGCATVSDRGDSTGVDLDPSHREIIVITVGDAVEASLLEERLGATPIRIEGPRLYFPDGAELRRSLIDLGYEPRTVNPWEVGRRVVRLSRDGKAPERIDALGLELVNREPEYWVVSGSLTALRGAVEAGFDLVPVRDPEPRPRQVKVVVPSTQDVVKLGGLMDIYNVSEDKRQVVVDGAAFDAQIDRIRALGFAVEIVPGKRAE